MLRNQGLPTPNEKNFQAQPCWERSASALSCSVSVTRKEKESRYASSAGMSIFITKSTPREIREIDSLLVSSVFRTDHTVVRTGFFRGNCEEFSTCFHGAHCSFSPRRTYSMFGGAFPDAHHDRSCLVLRERAQFQPFRVPRRHANKCSRMVSVR